MIFNLLLNYLLFFSQPHARLSTSNDDMLCLLPFLLSTYLMPCLFVLLFLNFWKSWLMTNWIVDYLILVIDFYNIYLAFLHTKILKRRYMWTFQLLIHFFINLPFSIPKTNFNSLFVSTSCFSAEKANWNQKQTWSKYVQ
jgi:hypothetical protein